MCAGNAWRKELEPTVAMLAPIVTRWLVAVLIETLDGF